MSDVTYDQEATAKLALGKLTAETQTGREQQPAVEEEAPAASVEKTTTFAEQVIADARNDVPERKAKEEAPSHERPRGGRRP